MGSSPLQASQTPTATTCPASGASLPSSGPSCSASTLTATGLTLLTSASSAISDPGIEVSVPWGPQDLDSVSETSGGPAPAPRDPRTMAENTQQKDLSLRESRPIPFVETWMQWEGVLPCCSSTAWLEGSFSNGSISLALSDESL